MWYKILISILLKIFNINDFFLRKCANLRRFIKDSGMIVYVNRISKLSILLILLLSLTQSGFAKNNTIAITKLQDLVGDPKGYLNKKINIEGEFHSYSSLSLDYEKAYRDPKEFIGIILSRPDEKEIPLVELKLSAPLEMFKDEDITIERGDKLRLNSKVYAVALGEPWLEIKDLEVIKKAKKED